MQLTYEQVEQFLRNYSTGPAAYDFNGLLALVLVGVDNLRVHGVRGDLEDYAETISDQQADFLRALLELRGKNSN